MSKQIRKPVGVTGKENGVGSNHAKAFKQDLLRYAFRLEQGAIDSAKGPQRLKLMGAYWRTAREETGLSTRDLACRLGLEETDLRAFEKGLRDPDDDMPEGFVAQLAKALGRVDRLAVHITLFDSPLTRDMGT
jgi:predicted transcriptional regulator